MTTINKIAFSALSAAALTSAAFAGTPMRSSGKESKPMEPMEDLCFKDHEFSLDVFGSYTDGNGNDHAGPFQDHGWGGGIGVNYFFTRNLGVGLDGSAVYGRETSQSGGLGDSAKHTTHYALTSSFIVRFPIDRICMAPYIFAGGGYHTNGDEWASAHAGVGLEYRVVPNRIALFTDARFTYFGTRYGHDDQNNYTGRAGVRFVF